MPLDVGPTPSIFDPAGQHTDPDAKLVAAVERLGQALRVLLWEQAREVPGGLSLSPVQIQTLVFLRFHDERMARVGELAREFTLSSPTVSDAVSTLVTKGLVVKAPAATDRRASVLRLTEAGVRVADGLAGWAEPMRAQLRDMPDEQKAVTLRFLMDLIVRLQQVGTVTVTRMCLTCRHFGENVRPGADAPHQCRLVDLPLSPLDLRVDCPEHERLAA